MQEILRGDIKRGIEKVNANGIGQDYYQNSRPVYSPHVNSSHKGTFAAAVASVSSGGHSVTIDSDALHSSSVDVYRKYLESKYGKVTVKDVPKDQKTLEKLGKSMGGNDVVIAPNILEEMANDPEKASYYEGKIDYFFDTIIPRETARCASMGLVFEPAGVVVHKDGTVTYICGCSDSPERVAQVNAINKAKREKRAAQREAAFERSREEAAERARQLELSDRRRSMAEALAGYGAYGQKSADLDVLYIGLGLGL